MLAERLALERKRVPVVIGENMRRVTSYAALIGGHVYRPRKNDPFDKQLALYRNGRWIQSMIRQGREVIDIGPDFARRSLGRPPSEYYNLERRQLEGYENYSKVFIRMNKNAGGVPGFDW